jgi:DNA repair exonuclease SbcCD ATPase subunit
MIKKLYIKNFRNISELTIYPSSYINLISGNNGEGKSSILYAIEYLLTDNLNEKISEYVKWGQDKFNLEMEFDFNGSSYTMKVEGSKSSKKELIVNESDVYKNSDATKYLATIIDPNIARYSAISEQGKTAQILFDTPANRLKKLKEILGIDKLFEIVEDIKEEIKEINTSIDLKKKEIEVLENIDYNFMDEIILPDIDSIKQEFTLIVKDKELYESQIKLYEKYVQEIDNYNNTLSKIESNEILIKGYQEKLKEKEGSKKLYTTSNSLEDLQKTLNEIIKNETEQNSRYNIYKDKKSRIEKLNNNISIEETKLLDYPLRRLASCKYTNDELTEAEKVLTEYQIKLRELEKEYKLGLEGKCPTCSQDYIIDVQSHQTQIEDIKQDIKDISLQIKNIKEEFDNYNKLYNEYETNKIQRQNILDNLERYKKELDEVSNGYENEFNLIDYSKDKIEIENNISSIKSTDEFNNTLDKDIQDIQNKIEVCKNIIEQYKDITEPVIIDKPKDFDFNKYESLNKEILVYEQKMQEQQRVNDYNNKIKEDKLNNNNKIKTVNSDIENLYYKGGILKETREVLDKQFSSYLIDRGADYIKEKMNEFFITAYGKYDITFTQDKNSIDFYYGDGDNVSPCSMASGMEKSILAMAFRVALSSLNNLGIMILDEIDSDGSSDRSLSLYESILSTMINSQLFIITHKEETKEYLMQQHGSNEFSVVNGTIN